MNKRKKTTKKKTVKTNVKQEKKSKSVAMKNLHELFVSELQQMYDAEKQIVKALPLVIEAASSKKLKEALSEHLEETREQVGRLEIVFRELGQEISGKPCDIMEHLLNKATQVIQSDYDHSVKDAALINCAQHVEHYEIASYGMLKSLAKNFEYDRIYDLLDETSDEEGAADKKLTSLAKGTLFTKGINAKALKHAA